MKILAFLKEVPDVRVPLGFDRHTGRLKAEWNTPMLNPADRSAVHAALALKRDVPDTHITLVHIGLHERFIREGLSAGCDQGIRVWDDGFHDLQPYSKAVILARVAIILGFDLILLGSKSHDTANGQIAHFLACLLQVPCIASLTSLERVAEKGVVTKRLAGGFCERMENRFPFIAAFEPGEECGTSPLLPTLLEASESEVERLDLAAIGIPKERIEELNGRLVCGPPRLPRPRTRFIPAPSSALPAFDRIKRLVEGTVKRRGGKVVTGDEGQVVEDLFQTLLAEGWLDHLRKRQ